MPVTGRAECVRPRGELSHEGQRLGNHEAARPGLLDRVPDGIQADHPNPSTVKPRQHRIEVPFAFGMIHINIDLLVRERGPEQELGPTCGLVPCERQNLARTVEREQIRFAGSTGKYAGIRQEHPRVRRIVVSVVVVLELRRTTRNVIDDQVRHDLGPCGEGAHILPRTQARIDLRVVDRVEARIGSVDREEERKQVNATERAVQRPGEQLLEVAEASAGQPIHVCDELRLILHARTSGVTSGMAPSTLATRAPV
jgi:hypothetical protein